MNLTLLSHCSESATAEGTLKVLRHRDPVQIMTARKQRAVGTLSHDVSFPALWQAANPLPSHVKALLW